MLNENHNAVEPFVIKAVYPRRGTNVDVPDEPALSARPYPGNPVIFGWGNGRACEPVHLDGLGY